MAKTDFETALANSLRKLMRSLKGKLARRLAAQGHVLTGKLRDSISYKVERVGSKMIAEMTALDYGMIIEVGVPAGRIPYSGRTGKGGTSQYIQGLVRFWQIKKGLSARESLRAAFATAAVHKREGIPSRGSYGHSRNGERTNWIKNTLQDNLEQIGLTLKNEVGLILTLEYEEELKFEPIKFYV